MKSPAPPRASALVIVLAFVVLLTATVVAFLTRVQIGVHYSQTSADGTRADAFCRGAIDQVVGDLKQEIAAGSTIIRDANGTARAYLPMNTSGRRQNLLPYPVNASSANLSLVKESLPVPFYATTTTASYDTTDYPAPNRVSGSVSTTPSANGRLISTKRWNKSLLLPGTSGDDDTPSGTFTAPNWVYVGRDGSNPGGGGTAVTPAAFGALADQTSSSYVLGRYAYAVYDEAALLDINAAGYPSGTSSAQVTAKGSLGLADLTQLGLSQTLVDAVVGWRNYASAQPTGSFPTYGFPGTTGATNYYNLLMGISGGSLLPTPTSGTSTAWAGVRRTGFLTVANQNLYTGQGTGQNNGQSDHLFSTRQELIRMLVHDLAKNTADRATMKTALQSLGTFSRTLNAPSWLPVTPGPPAVSTASAIDYAGNAIKQARGLTLPSTPANQIAPAVLVKTQFTRDDGTTANVGDPLLKYRFPLRRLEWFNAANASQTAIAAAIKQWFCLARSTSPSPAGTWNYVDPDSHQTVTAALPTIKTLDQVAALGREPTYWELLQAALLSGSVGQSRDSPTQTLAHAYDTSNDSKAVRHVLQIGLNVIDQYNGNTAPTVLSFGPVMGMGASSSSPAPLLGIPIAGVKNLPYFYALGEQYFATQAPAPTITSYTYLGYMQFLLWNPHYNAAAMKTGGGGTANSFRIVANGQAQSYYFSGQYNGDKPSSVAAYGFGTETTTGASANTISFTANGSRFAAIDMLVPADTSLTGANALVTYTSTVSGQVTQVGFSLGKWPATSPNAIKTNPPLDPATGMMAKFALNPPAKLSFRLEIQDDGGNWVPYQILSNWNDGGTCDGTDRTPPMSALTTFMNVTPAAQSDAFVNQLLYVVTDPRTTRFGNSDGNDSGVTLKGRNWTLIDPGTGKPLRYGTGSEGLTEFSGGLSPSTVASGGWVYNATGNATLCPQYDADNSAAANATAMDNVLRQADGNINLPVSIGHPLFNSGTAGVVSPARPLFLGRSFNSVAEMGYAGRDLPWKTLNFYSADSADGALLDYFSLSETSAQAGGVNVNTASAPALAAMLRGAYTDANDASSGLTAAEAASIAGALRAYLGTTHANVAYDPSDVPALAGQVAKASAFPAARTVPATLKRAQEVVARALSDSWNTRTWNLLIDVVAQTGRLLPAGAGKTNPLDQFVADGEKRVWAHVAIDRFTGQIVDVQLEPVTE